MAAPACSRSTRRPTAGTTVPGDEHVHRPDQQQPGHELFGADRLGHRGVDAVPQRQSFDRADAGAAARRRQPVPHFGRRRPDDPGLPCAGQRSGFPARAVSLHRRHLRRRHGQRRQFGRRPRTARSPPSRCRERLARPERLAERRPPAPPPAAAPSRPLRGPWSSPTANPPAIIGASTSTATVIAPTSGSITVRVTVTDDQGRADIADVLSRTEPRDHRGAGQRPAPPPARPRSFPAPRPGGPRPRSDARIRPPTTPARRWRWWRRRFARPRHPHLARRSCAWQRSASSLPRIFPVAFDRCRAIFASYAIDGSGSPLQLQLKALRQVCDAERDSRRSPSDNETTHVACLRSARISHASARPRRRHQGPPERRLAPMPLQYRSRTTCRANCACSFSNSPRRCSANVRCAAKTPCAPPFARCRTRKPSAMRRSSCACSAA